MLMLWTNEDDFAVEKLVLYVDIKAFRYKKYISHDLKTVNNDDDLIIVVHCYSNDIDRMYFNLIKLFAYILSAHFLFY